VEGFTSVPGVKPKASDYTPIPHALILRACSDYSAHIVAIHAFPPVKLQVQWAKECFRSAGRASGERYIFTDRIGKIITARGSQIRGKIIEAYRALFAAHYGFQRSTTKKIILANMAKAAKLLKKAAFHYKDTAARKDYGENKIILAVRQLTVFRHRDSVGVLFSSHFDPISIPHVVLDISALEFCVNEWVTGTFIQAKFYEKDVVERYRVHLIDTEKWSNANQEVVKNIRRKWYRKASETLTSAPAVLVTNMDEADEDVLRDELADRTGNTESEFEEEDAVMTAA